MMYYPQEIGRSVNEVLHALNALQVADANDVAIPENYPKNNWIGSNVIVPPANTEEMKKERLADAAAGKFTCKDWWLCHKSL